MEGPVDLDELEDRQFYAEFEKKLQAKEELVLKAPLVEINLSLLAHAGADPERILRLLVLSPWPENVDLMRTLERKRGRLRALSSQLDVTAEELGRTFADPLSFTDFWLSTLQPIGIPFPDLGERKKITDPDDSVYEANIRSDQSGGEETRIRPEIPSPYGKFRHHSHPWTRSGDDL